MICQHNSTLGDEQMNKVDEINAAFAKIEAERDSAILMDKVNVLAKMKADIKIYGFKKTDFKWLFKSRVTKKQVEENTIELY